MRNFVLGGAIVALTFGGAAFAADTQTINGQLAEEVQAATRAHVQQTQQQLGGTYVAYDAVTSEVRNLKFKKMRKQVVKTGDYYETVAIFVDGNGKKYDVDFQITGRDGTYLINQTGMRRAGSKKR